MASLLFASCRTTPTEEPVVLPPVDRFAAAYPVLRQGRFLILADFHDPRSLPLAQWLRGSAMFPPRRVTAPDGWADGGVLWFEVGASGDGIILADARSGEIMPRDWRDYDLLLLSLISPCSGRFARVELTGPAGSAARVGERSLRMPLRGGRNLLRVDLADWSERVPLRDVRAVRVTIEGVNGPEVYGLADVALTVDRETMFSADGATGSLYVERAADRFRAGAAGRFEFTFAGARIAAWHDTANDPYRAHNRIGDIGWDFLSIDEHDGGGGVPDLVTRSEAECGWVELNAVRVVMECTGAGPGEGRRRGHARFVLHADGSLFVETTWDSSVETAALGWTFALRRRGEPWRCSEPSAGGESAVRASMLTCSAGPVGLRLAAWPPMKLHDMGPAGAELDLFRWSPIGSGADRMDRVQGLSLDVGSPSRLGAVPAETSNAFRTLPAIKMETGEILPPRGGGADGFDWGEGGFVVRPAGGRVGMRLTRATDDKASFNVVVETSPGRDGWVYINQKLHNAVVRDARGRLLFRVPAALPGPAVVEVLFRPTE